MEQQITTNSNTKTHKKSHKPSRKITIALIIAAVVILLAAIIGLVIIPRSKGVACSGLIGTWRYSGTEYTGNYTYIFREDGTGKYISPDKTEDFGYIDNIETFFILSPDGASYTDYVYEVSEDNTSLTIIDSLGNPIPYACR